MQCSCTGRQTFFAWDLLEELGLRSDSTRWFSVTLTGRVRGHVIVCKCSPQCLSDSPPLPSPPLPSLVCTEFEKLLLKQPTLDVLFEWIDSVVEQEVAKVGGAGVGQLHVVKWVWHVSENSAVVTAASEIHLEKRSTELDPSPPLPARRLTRAAQSS